MAALRQLEIRADTNYMYFVPLSVRYTRIADSRRSCRSSWPLNSAVL